jgi:hypothetical protein
MNQRRLRSLLVDAIPVLGRVGGEHLAALHHDRRGRIVDQLRERVARVDELAFAIEGQRFGPRRIDHVPGAPDQLEHRRCPREAYFDRCS